MFDNFNVNLRKNEGFLTYIPCIPIPEYGQSNAPLVQICTKIPYSQLSRRSPFLNPLITVGPCFPFLESLDKIPTFSKPNRKRYEIKQCEYLICNRSALSEQTSSQALPAEHGDIS